MNAKEFRKLMEESKLEKDKYYKVTDVPTGKHGIDHIDFRLDHILYCTCNISDSDAVGTILDDAIRSKLPITAYTDNGGLYSDYGPKYMVVVYRIEYFNDFVEHDSMHPNLPDLHDTKNIIENIVEGDK